MRLLFRGLILCLSTQIFCTEPSLFEKYQSIEDQNTLKILTPKSSSRKTKKIRLENGLEVLLISDPAAKQSAAALAVEVGSWQDPEEYPGTAHFLEHMLFMGTKTYPDESEYLQYIHDHGGEVNAYTAPHHTVYGFAVGHHGFFGSLQRFSRFFIDPLFASSCIDRELHAVDQEHGKNIENDAWRAYMVLKESGNQQHPNVKFSTGNANTLSGIPKEVLLNWYLEHYSADRMHLILLSSFPLEEMISLVVECFSPVISSSPPLPEYPQELFSHMQKGHFIYVKPVKDIKLISLIWQLPKEIATHCHNPAMRPISYSLEHGVEGGLLQGLKKEKLARDVSASFDRWSKDTLTFSIDISLTERGVKHFKKVIHRVYKALNHLKQEGIPSYIFDELQKMAILEYEYQSQGNAFSYVMKGASALIFENLGTFPQRSVVAESCDLELTQEILNYLQADSCIYLIMADPLLLNREHAFEEKWTSASYSIEEIPAPLISFWDKTPRQSNMMLPQPNPYLPENLFLLPQEEASQLDSPELLFEEEGGKFFFQHDLTYLLPKVSVIFSLKTPLIDGTAKGMALFDLFLASLNEKLDATLFYSHYAGMRAQLYQRDFDFRIIFHGYSEKMPLFFKNFFQLLMQLSPSSQEFDLYKESLLSAYDNGSKELPLHQSVQLLNNILFNNSPTPFAKYRALKEISYENFLCFAKGLFQSCYVEGLLYGNLTRSQAQKMWGGIKETLQATPFLQELHYKKGVLLPTQGPCMLIAETQRQGNSTVLVLHEGSFSHKKRGIQRILSTALKDDFFNTLRTKQQTGYITTTWDANIEHQLLQFFAVQSITHHPQELLARFELFLEEFYQNICSKITPSRFELLKASLVENLQKPPNSLEERAEQLYEMAFKHGADFHWIDKGIEASQAISYECFVKEALHILSRSNLKRIAILTEGVLPDKNRFKYETITEEEILNIGQYVTMPPELNSPG